MSEFITESPVKRRPGRPPLPPEERKMNFAIRLHPDEGELLKLHAQHHGISQSKLVGLVLRKYFDEPKRD